MIRVPTAPGQSTIGLLRLLLAGCIVLPFVLFAASSWLEYRAAFADAERGLARAADVAREQAGRVFEEENDVADRVGDMVRAMTQEDAAQSERSLHTEFATVVIRRPSVEGVLLAGADGVPVAAAGIYPVPKRASLTNRDFFRAIVLDHQATYLSPVQTGDVNGIAFMGLAKPWLGSDGAVRGVISVAVLPESFRYFYGALTGEVEQRGAAMSISLVRADGVKLVSQPEVDAGPRTPAFRAAIAANPGDGASERPGLPGMPPRLVVYRRVRGVPAYVVVARNRGAVVQDWAVTLAGHALIWLAVTLALVGITILAIRRTRQEERALSRARDEIARREATEAALLRAQRLEAVGQMTGGVAHDFNNLLTVILGSAESLGRAPADVDRVRRIAEQIILAARRGGEITAQLLAFSRRQLFNTEVLDLNASLREFAPLLERAVRGAPGRAIGIEFAFDPALGLVRLDAGHFQSAILNLVGNARDAIPAGGTITIGTRNLLPGEALPPELPAGAYVEVWVGDTGSGMDADTAAKAFEPFFTTKPVGRGTGLGLSQVYGFTKQAGGDVRIVSAPGAGTTIELLLPRVEAPSPRANEPARAATVR